MFIRVEKRWNSTIDLMGRQLLVQLQLRTSRCTRVVIIFQQQLRFHIKTTGSVKIFWWIRSINRSNDDSTCQACMRETDADKPWYASLGKSSFSTHRRRDVQGGSNARHSWLVDSPSQLTSRTWSACVRTLLWKSELRFGRRCFKSGNTKTEVQCSCLLSPEPKEIYFAIRKVWWLDNSKAQSRKRRMCISEQSLVRCRGTRSRHSVDTLLSV